MPLDPNIILSGTQMASPLDTAVKAMTLKSLSQRSKLADQEIADQDAIRTAYKNNLVVDAAGSQTLNKAGVLSELGKTNPTAAVSLKNQFDKDNLDQLTKQLEVGRSLIGSIPTGKEIPMAQKQAAWTLMKTQGAKYGLPNNDNLPDQYPGDDYVNHMNFSLMSAKEKLDQQNKDREFGLKQDELNVKREEVRGKNKKESGTLATELRKERSTLPTTKATQEVSAAYNRVQAAAKNPSAAGDLALIFNYMKMLDPGSTVREGEFATAQNSAGVPTRIQAQYNQILNGQRLAPEQRQDFIGQASGQYEAQNKLQKQVDSKYISLAKKAGIDPEDVLVNFDAEKVASKLDSLPDDELDKLYKQAGGK